MRTVPVNSYDEWTPLEEVLFLPCSGSACFHSGVNK
jgi:hypothetical protein